MTDIHHRPTVVGIVNMRHITSLILLLTATAASAIELETVAVIGTPVRGSKEAWQGHVNFLTWVGADTLVYGGESGFVKCYSLRMKSEVWGKVVNGKITQLVAGGGALFLLDNHGNLHVLGAIRGTPISTLDPDTLASTAGTRSLIPDNIAWVPERNVLLVATHSQEYGENSYFMDSQSFKLVGRMKSDGFLTKIKPTEDGSDVLTLSNRGHIRIWEIAQMNEVFNMGEDTDASIDAPFISNAVFDGKTTLIYAVDNSWATGTLRVYDTEQKKELARFDSRNGHLEMDVDFRTSRVALTGTSRTLTLVDFTGRILAEQPQAADQRIVVVKFSPDGSHLALGSWDNTVRVFRITTNDANEAMAVVVDGADVGTNDVNVAELAKRMPKDWVASSVVPTDSPEGWQRVAGGQGVTIRFENPVRTVHDPMVGDYHPSYRITLMPLDWAGRNELGDTFTNGMLRAKTSDREDQVYPDGFRKTCRKYRVFESYLGQDGWDDPFVSLMPYLEGAETGTNQVPADTGRKFADPQH